MPRLPTAAVILFFLSFGCNRPAPAPAPAATPAPETPNVPNASNSALPPGERVENPRYRQWSAHKPGTTVVVREKTDTPAYKTETTSTFKLKKIDDDRAVVEVTSEIVAPDGTRSPTEPQELSYARWIAAPTERAKKDVTRPPGTVEERNEPITVLGREYQATWYKSKGRVEAGETITETWIVDDIPGGLARSVHSIPAAKKTITTELVEIKNP